MSWLRIYLVPFMAQLVFLLLCLATAHYRWTERTALLEDKRQEVQRFNYLIAENTARNLQLPAVLVRQVANDLSRRSDAWLQWNSDQGWNYLARFHQADIEPLLALQVYTANGKFRFSSNNQLAADGGLSAFLPREEVSGSFRAGPFLHELTGRYLYLIGERISLANSGEAVYVVALVSTNFVQDFCWIRRLPFDFESFLINRRGQTLASCRPSDFGTYAALIGRDIRGYLGFDVFDTNAAAASSRKLINRHAIEAFPELQVLTLINPDEVLQGWEAAHWELLAYAVLIQIMLALLWWRVYRQQREIGRLATVDRDHLHALEAERDALREALAAKQQESDLAQQAKSRFLAAASHDLRQPMHALLMFSSHLKVRANELAIPDLAHLANQLNESGQWLSELLNALLDISRMDVAGVQTNLADFELQAVFDRLLRAHRFDAEQKEQSLRFRATAYRVQSDPLLVERALSNLISNAIRYTPKGSNILVLARMRGGKVQLEVRDNGNGIPPEHQAAIFKEFYQIGNQARERQQGLGLGLSIVERIGRALGTTIGLRSALYRGTTFSFQIPLAQAASQPKSSPVSLAQPVRQRPVCVLGNGLELSGVVSLLQGWGLPVIRHEDVLQTPPEQPVDAVVLADIADAEFIRQRWAGALTLVGLVAKDQTVVPPVLAREDQLLMLNLPLRPARLRAILTQLNQVR